MALFNVLNRSGLSLLGLGLLGGLAGCQTDINAPAATSAGNANFARYVAVGNSLTAGFEDGGLYLEGQQNSYPLILSQQLAKAGGGQFRQPLFTTAQANGSGYVRLTGLTAAGPVTQNVTSSLALRGATSSGGPLYTKYLDPIDNLGVPGIRVADVQTADFGNTSASRPGGYSSANFNPYFERITPDGNNQSYFQRVKAEAASTTFFSFWLGNNDVLGYATSGGSAQTTTATTVGILTLPANTGVATPPPNTITRVDSFTAKATRMVAALSAGGARGVITNIPDVTGIPFFTTVGPGFRARLTAAGAAGVVAFTGGNAGGLASGNRKQIATSDIRDASGNGRQLFTLTSSPFLGLLGQPTGAPWRYIFGQSGLPRALFPAYLGAFAIDTTKAFGASLENPLPSAFVLDDTEQGLVATATNAYNSALLTLATNRGLAFFDANVYFRQIAATGVATNGVNNSAAYITGNLFSLDGVHPTPRGYALVANEIIRAINNRYGSTVPQVNANEYRGILLP